MGIGIKRSVNSSLVILAFAVGVISCNNPNVGAASTPYDSLRAADSIKMVDSLNLVDTTNRLIDTTNSQ